MMPPPPTNSNPTSANRLSSCSQKDKWIKAFVASLSRDPCSQLKNKYYQDILYADDRHGDARGSGMVMLNTYSSFCMYPVISKQFTAAVREINKAEKQVRAHQPAALPIPGVAKKALEVALAAVIAADSVDHWRVDTESPEEVEKLAKRLVAFVKGLLWFTDAELGFADAYSRPGLLGYLTELAEDWTSNASRLGYTLSKMNFKTAKNGNGLGRSLSNSGDANPNPAKKQKTVQVATVAVAAAGPVANNRSTSGGTLTSYFSNIAAKLDKRVKTLVQLQITDLQDPKRRVEHVVLSGATDMKKTHQLLAYLTGCSSTFEYHSQRGSYVKGCRFELSLPNYRTCWIAPPASAKQGIRRLVHFATGPVLGLQMDYLVDYGLGGNGGLLRRAARSRPRPCLQLRVWVRAGLSSYLGFRRDSRLSARLRIVSIESLRYFVFVGSFGSSFQSFSVRVFLSCG